jgi:phospholipase C
MRTVKTALFPAAAMNFGGYRHRKSGRRAGARIKTIVVIYDENRSFDHLYGFFPEPTAS